MKSKNTHIEKYIDYYLQLKSPPEYAILLRGKWGIGKTWFIKKYINKKNTKKFIFISLYGVSKFTEIEEIIFQQVHPILGSKGMKLAGKILKGALKATIRLDLDGDQKDDININSSIPDIKLPEYLKKLDNKTLVFDDLERSSIKIKNLFGYINQLVESNGQKVIILANEEEIIKNLNETNNEKTINEYLRTKEKLIGKSFEIFPDTKGALNQFLSIVENKNAKALLSNNKDLILSIYKSSTYQNLRHLRQSIQDFDQFFKFLPNRTFEKDNLVKHIFQLFFILSIEIKSGQMSEEDIPRVFVMDLIISDNKNKNSLYHKLKTKYSILDHTSPPIKEKTWYSFFKYGQIDKKDIEYSIANCYYFIDENTPNWEKLWHYFDLEDDDFDKIVKEVYNNLSNLKYENQYIVIQVIGIFIKLIKLSLVDYDKNSIIQKGKDQIYLLKDKKILEVDLRDGMLKHISHNKKYQSLDDKDFRDFLLFVKEQASIVEETKINNVASQLISKIKSPIQLFGDEITLNNNKRYTYYDVPVMQHMNSDDFINKIIDLSNKDKKELSWIIERRYQVEALRKNLKKEKEWLEEVHSKLKVRINEMPVKMSKGILEEMVLKNIELAIKLLR